MDNAGAMMVIALVGLVFPIGLLLLAFLFDVLVVLWAAYDLGHEDVSRRLAWVVRGVAHVPHWHWAHKR